MKIINQSGHTLLDYLYKQTNYLFPNKLNFKEDLKKVLDLTLDRTGYCFKHINNKYYFEKDEVIFDIFHSDQYSQFLFFLSRACWMELNNQVLSNIFYLMNKYLNNIDVFYEIDLPNIFHFSHPLGTVLGRANYDDYLYVSQGVTVGGNLNLEYPCIKKGVYLGAGSKIIGNSEIAENNLISVGTKVINIKTQKNSIIFNNDKNKIFDKYNKINIMKKYFK